MISVLILATCLVFVSTVYRYISVSDCEAGLQPADPDMIKEVRKRTLLSGNGFVVKSFNLVIGIRQWRGCWKAYCGIGEGV